MPSLLPSNVDGVPGRNLDKPARGCGGAPLVCDETNEAIDSIGGVVVRLAGGVYSSNRGGCYEEDPQDGCASAIEGDRILTESVGGVSTRRHWCITLLPPCPVVEPNRYTCLRLEVFCSNNQYLFIHPNPDALIVLFEIFQWSTGSDPVTCFCQVDDNQTWYRGGLVQPAFGVFHSIPLLNNAVSMQFPCDIDTAPDFEVMFLR